VGETKRVAAEARVEADYRTTLEIQEAHERAQAAREEVGYFAVVLDGGNIDLCQELFSASCTVHRPDLPSGGIKSGRHEGKLFEANSQVSACSRNCMTCSEPETEWWLASPIA
jgi:hypothetical protein